MQSSNSLPHFSQGPEKYPADATIAHFVGWAKAVSASSDQLAADSTVMHYRSMFQQAWEAIPAFHYVLNATAKEISPDHVTYTDKDGADHEIPSDSVVLSVGMRAKADEALSFYGVSRSFWMVGDCKKPGTIQTTNRSAYGVAMNI